MVRVEDIGQECVALKTRMAARNISRLYDEAFRPLGLRGTQFTLLCAIQQGAPGSISALAEHLAMERTTLTRNLQLLEAAGLVDVGAEGYRRARPLRLTRAGRAMLRKAIPVWQDTQERLVVAFGRDQWNETRRMLERLSRNP